MRSTQGFTGTDRYEVQGVLGAGGMGVVYDVLDRTRGSRVALKTLRRLDPAAIYRFKREFRAIARAAHRNLVALYELVAEPDRCFFTMELVEGIDFLRYVGHSTWPGAVTASGAPSLELADGPNPEPLPRLVDPVDVRGATRPPLDDVVVGGARLAVDAHSDTTPRALPLPARMAEESVAAGLDEARLRAALRQLTEGVMALHQLGCLHRDIKPSNVLVTGEGRVVLLDLGLVTWISPVEASFERYVAGTAAYMSPEQAMARPLTEASDWYSVGVMLYEALTGSRPFRGTFEQVIARKQVEEPRRPSELVEGVSEPLEALCLDLLRIPPGERPGGEQILRRLRELPGGAADLELPPVPSVSVPAPGSAFVGRGQQLDRLADAWRQTIEGACRPVHLHGVSGMGKSALLRRFLHDVSGGRDAAVVLSGRCYQRESVPFKGVDGLVDALSRYLRSLPRARADGLLPSGIAELARVFPVLEQVEAVSMLASPRPQGLDPHELRRRAFGALRELLARIGARRPLVLCVDDLQWGDVDSAQLLAELTRPPDPPSLMLLCSYRTDEIAGCSHLQLVRAAHGLGDETEAPVQVGTEVELGPLDEGDAAELARRLLGEDSDVRRGQASAVAAEAEGNPFFVHELVRWLQQTEAELSAPDQQEPATVRLEAVMNSRLERLPEQERTVLETVAIAGRPLPRSVLALATDLGPGEQRAVDHLRGTSMLRVRVVAGEEALEPYHDRIRMAVVHALPAWKVRQRHMRLALALQGSRQADPESLAEHFCGAGHLERAGEYALLAAEQAGEAVAFERAAMLLRFAMRMLEPAEVTRRGLRARLADALARAGRSSEAAAVFGQCVGEAEGRAALEFRARAAGEHLRAGQLDEGLEDLTGVLDGLGMPYPATPAAALRSLVARRLRLRLRGLGWRERDAGETSPVDRMRLDTCWAVSSGLGMIDPIRGADYQTRGLLLALHAGDPAQVARFLALEATYSSTSGPGGRRRAHAILKEAAALAERLGEPHLRGLVCFAAAVDAYEGGDWRRAREMAERAERIYLDYCTGVSLELATNRHFLLLALLQLGELAEMATRAPAYIQDAEARGDRFSSTSFRNGCMNICWLVDGDPGRARLAVATAMAPWRQGPFLLQHYEGLYAEATIDLYEGVGRQAGRRIHRDWSSIRSAQLLKVQQLHLEALYLRGRAALCAAVDPTPDEEPDGIPVPGARGLLAEARKTARRMLRERMAWSDPLAQLLRAGAAAAEGRQVEAVALLEELVPTLDLQDMKLYAAAARRRLGELRGGQAGEEAIRQADDVFRRQGVRDPEAMTALFAPGFAVNQAVAAP